MKKKLFSVLLCLCTVVSILSTSALAAGFTDVKSDAYYAKPVDWAVEKGVTTGTGDGTTFSPNNTCTRAQILTFLWRAAGSPESVVFLMNPYLDISEDAYYYEAALWAKQCGMVQGSYFEPNTPCTRAAAVEYIWRYERCPSATAVSFKDVTAGTDAAKAISWAVNYGVTNGVTATTFEPGKTCTRGQIVTFLYRYFVEPLEFKESTTPAPKPSAPTNMKLDPLPPENYKKHPDWYMSLTLVQDMDNARLAAEYKQINAVIADYRARDAYISDSLLVRQQDLMYAMMERYEPVREYDEFMEKHEKYGSYVPSYIYEDYEEVVEKYGDPQPLRDFYS